MTYAQTIESNNTPLTASDNIFNNFKEWALFNFVKQFEYTVDIGEDQVFPNKTIKHKIVDRYEPSEYALPMLKYSMLGFDISATDIRIKTESKKIDENNTNIDFPLMVAKNVKVSNGLLINLAYNDIDMSSIYAICNPNTDKLPSSATADLLKTSSTFSELLRPTFVFKLMYAEDNEKIVSESDFGLLIFFIIFLKKTQTSN